MDSSLQSVHLTGEEKQSSLGHQEEGLHDSGPHIHLPNPSLWPLVLSAAILVTVIGLLFVPETPWLTIFGAPFILVGIMGWALEDPMAPMKPELVEKPSFIRSKVRLGSDVFDQDGELVGTLQGRFQNYLLIEKGDDFFAQAMYIPRQFVQNEDVDLVRLNVSSSELQQLDLNEVPDDLYTSGHDEKLASVKGTPQFGRRPLSPAQTGHYNFGPNYPGINTDAANSYPRNDIQQFPQHYVSTRKKVYADS